MARLTKVSLVLESVAELKGLKAFNAELTRVQAATKRLGPSLKFAKNVMGGLSIAGGIAAGAVIKAASAAMNYADQMRTMADQTGASTSAIQALGYVARQNGTNLETMTAAMVQAQKAAAEAAAGNDQAAQKFARLGISATDFARLRPEQQMERLGRAINGASDRQEALAAAMDIVGARNAPRLMAALQQLGADGFDRVAKQAQEAGQVMSAATVRDLGKAKQEIESFTTRVTILAGEYLRLSRIAFAGGDKLADASEALAKAEAKSGMQSRETAKARLDYIDVLLKEGKVKQAMVELNRTPDAFERQTGRAGGRINADAAAIAKRRAATAAAIARAKAEQEVKTTEQAERAKADAAEAAGVQAEAAAKRAADAEKKRIAEILPKYRAFLQDKQRAEDKAADEAYKKAVEHAEALKKAQEAAANPERNEMIKRGLALSGQDLTGGPGFTPPKMPTDPAALRTQQVINFTMPDDLSVDGMDKLIEEMRGIRQELRERRPDSAVFAD